jgi:hypothetical protein
VQADYETALLLRERRGHVEQVVALPEAALLRTRLRDKRLDLALRGGGGGGERQDQERGGNPHLY